MSDSNLTTGRREARAHKLRRRKVTIGVATGIVSTLVIGAGIAFAISATQHPDNEAKASQVDTPPRLKPTQTIAPEPAPLPTPTYDVDTPSSITVVVNKQRPFTPIDWAPDDLVLPEGIPNVWDHPIRAEAATALQQMYQAAVEAGVPFTITSGYREYWLQKEIYDDLVAQGGVEFADSDTARPGHSEHQTGLTVDLFGEEGCQLSACFGETATGIWLRDNGYHFGYILRYNDGEQATVGYTYEPWHFRYVGVEVATAMHDRGVLNLEDFFGLPPAPTN